MNEMSGYIANVPVLNGPQQRATVTEGVEDLLRGIAVANERLRDLRMRLNGPRPEPAARGGINQGPEGASIHAQIESCRRELMALHDQIQEIGTLL